MQFPNLLPDTLRCSVYAPTPVHPSSFFIDGILEGGTGGGGSHGKPLLPSTLPSFSSGHWFGNLGYEFSPWSFTHPPVSRNPLFTVKFQNVSYLNKIMFPFHAFVGWHSHLLLTTDSAGKSLLWVPFVHRPFHKRKGGQVRFSTEQTVTLERMFQNQKYLTPVERKQLASTLKLTERQVKTWFQNRRAKWRKLKE
uniref:Homeobox domain-containing protein n=1 Tax=Latimeria chalumnae TaxID=7897 RepID=H3AMM4_LATCH